MSELNRGSIDETDNVMKGNTLGIDLGGGPFIYNSIRPFSTGANHLQLCPDLLAAPDVGGTVDVSGQLEDFAHHSGFTIDLYTQAGCASDSVTPGQGEHMVTEWVVSTNLLGLAPFSIRLPRSGLNGGALTATATSSDGSTSEFSPCLTIGHTAATFTRSGVTIPGATIDASSLTTTGSKSDITRAARAITAKKKRPPPTARLLATLRPFCPAVTTGHCTGTILIRQPSQTTVIARLKLKLAPDDLGTLTLQLSKTLTKLLERAHRVKLNAKINAHDNAKRANHRTTTAHLTLLITNTGSRTS